MVCQLSFTSLMMDQQYKYSPKGLRSEHFGEAQSDPTAREKILNSDDQLVFITPNKTYHDIFLPLLIKTIFGTSGS